MRAGFITAGGVLGYTLGALRGRLMKKLVYAGIGLGTTSAISYPKEFAALTEEGSTEARKYAQIAYNFVTGG